MKTLQLITILICISLSSCQNISFDSEKWKNWEEKESNMRMRLDMVDDLISNYDLIGRSESEIEELLGEVGNKDSKSIMSYNLGPCRGIGVDYGVLMVKLKNGEVVGVEKRCH